MSFKTIAIFLFVVMIININSYANEQLIPKASTSYPNILDYKHINITVKDYRKIKDVNCYLITLHLFKRDYLKQENKITHSFYCSTASALKLRRDLDKFLKWAKIAKKKKIVNYRKKIGVYTDVTVTAYNNNGLITTKHNMYFQVEDGYCYLEIDGESFLDEFEANLFARSISSCGKLIKSLKKSKKFDKDFK